MTTTPPTGNTRNTSPLSRDRARGEAHGLEWAEYFHYIGPDESDFDAYVAKNAVPL